MVDLLQKALMITIVALIPLLGVTMLLGIIISVFQAATQIQEMTLTFIPKLFATLLMVILAGPWILRLLISFTTTALNSIPGMVK